jgi:hypothetical protein
MSKGWNIRCLGASTAGRSGVTFICENGTWTGQLEVKEERDEFF